MAYIDKEGIQSHLRLKCLAKYPDTFINGLLAAANEIGEMPTADVEVVRHGEWIEITDDVYFCSKCNRTIWFGGRSKDSFPYCHCGAKMDGGKAEL